MNKPASAETETQPSAGSMAPPHGYKEALMDAVRPRGKPLVGYGTGVSPARTDSNRHARAMATIANVHGATAPATRPTPTPKRPKGRFFIAALLVSLGALGAFS